MPVEIKIAQTTDLNSWDDYVCHHPQATLYHQACWGRVVQQTYGHNFYNLMAVRSRRTASFTPGISAQQEDKQSSTFKDTVVGVLPLVHINNFVFGNKFFSQPFADFGGVLADDDEVAHLLLSRAAEIAAENGVPIIEFRQTTPLAQSLLKPGSSYSFDDNAVSQRQVKVRMLLSLPDDSGQLMSSFKSKLRSQIRRPLKDGLVAKSGGLEFLNDYYAVFAENMRDLGSPVHSKSFFEHLIKALPAASRIFMVYKNDLPLACSLTLAFGSVLSNPWASSLKSHSRLSPNMLLYWTMFEYCCDNGFKTFDFGRSTPDEGTYRFKKQWGAVESPLCWQTISRESGYVVPDRSDKSKFDLAMRIWKHLPVSVSKAIGPSIRKNIGL